MSELLESAKKDVSELIGVYNADGGLVGEATYLVGHLLGRTQCALCDVTHSPVRRKPAWDSMVRDLGLPFRLLHRNELDHDEQAILRDEQTPIVLLRTASGQLEVLLRADSLDVGGSVDGFKEKLHTALSNREATARKRTSR